MRIIEVQTAAVPKLIEMIVQGRLLARLVDGTPPRSVFRVMSLKEYEIGAAKGVFEARRGERIHASIVPLFQFAEPGEGNALVEIKYDDQDGWQPKWMGDQVVVITYSSIPAQKVHLVGQGSRTTLEGEYSLMGDKNAI